MNTLDGKILKYPPIKGTTVIGIGHKARQGKDTTATIIERLVDGGMLRFGFADALYDVARAMFGMTEKDAPLLQVLGTDVFRRKDPEVWLRTLYYKIKDKSPRVAVITDVRFENEAAFVQEMGGYLIKVNRLNDDGSPFVAPDRSPNHPSETALDSFDDWNYVINAGSGRLDLIEKSVRAIVNHLEL